MKTETEFPGITTMRLTAVTNAADDLLHALDDDEDGEDIARIERCKMRLIRAIEVARGEDLPLPRHLFRNTADLSAVRLVESVIGLE